MPKRPDPNVPTDRELAFLDEYRTNGRIAVRAYMAVYPKASYDTARTNAAKLLAKAHIRRRLRRLEGECRRKSGITADRVLREWAALAFSDLGDVVDLERMALRKRMAPAARRAIASVKVTRSGAGKTARQSVDLRLHSKPDALDKVSRHLGLYKDLPDLERVLALLPPASAEFLRRELAAAVLAGAGAGGPGPAPGDDGGEPVAALGEAGGGAGGDGGGPGEPVPGGGVGAGPVAGAVPADDGGPGGALVLPPGGQVGDERGADAGPLAGPLFDDG